MFQKVYIDKALLMIILFFQSLPVVVNFTYQTDWAMESPDSW